MNQPTYTPPASLAAFQASDLKITFWVKLHKMNKAGKAPISMRLTFRSTRAEVSTGIRVVPDQYDEEGQLLRLGEWDQLHQELRGDSQAAAINNGYLKTLEAHVRELTLLLRAQGKPITAKLLSATLKAPLLDQAKAEEVVDFVDLCTEQFDLHYRQRDPATRIYMQSATDSLRRWTKNQPLPLHEFTPDSTGPAAFYEYLLHVEKKRVSTANLCLTRLTTLFYKAADAGLVDRDEAPFRKVKRKRRQVVERTRLRPEQLVKFRDAVLSGRQAEARDVYMTQYYLHGSRVGIVLSLQWKQVDAERVRFKADKGGPFKDVAITPELQKILDCYQPAGTADPEALVFPWLAADYHRLDAEERYRAKHRAVVKLTTALKQAAATCGLTGNIHSHTARHTFATHAASAAGIRATQNLLGHTTVRQTEIYVGSMATQELDQAAAATYGRVALLPPEPPVVPFTPTINGEADEEGGRVIQFRFGA